MDSCQQFGNLRKRLSSIDLQSVVSRVVRAGHVAALTSQTSGVRFQATADDNPASATSEMVGRWKS